MREAIRSWLQNEPDIAWFPQYNDRLSHNYALAAEEAHKAGFLVFGHTDNAPGSVRDGMDIIEHVWGFSEALMTPDELRAFRQGKYLTWATFLTDQKRVQPMITDAVRRGAYLNPTLHYEWGGLSKRAAERELEDYRTLSNPDLVYFPRNVMDDILAVQRQIKNFSSRYENMPWIVRLQPDDRKEFEAGYRNVLESDAGLYCGGRQDPGRHRHHCRRNAGPEPASRDGDAGRRGGAHAHAGDQGVDLMVGRIAGGQERRPRARQDRLDPRRKFCRSRRHQRRSD